MPHNPNKWSKNLIELSKELTEDCASRELSTNEILMVHQVMAVTAVWVTRAISDAPAEEKLHTMKMIQEHADFLIEGERR